MAVECTGRNVEITASVRELAEERTHRLERHLGGPADVRVVLSHEKHRYGAEILAIHRRRRWKAQEETGDPRAAVALAFEKIDAQAMRDSERRRDRKHRGWSRFLPTSWRAPAAGLTRPPGAPRIVPIPTGTSKTMGVEEAALALEASADGVIVFRDPANDRVSVLFLRANGDLALIVPEC